MLELFPEGIVEERRGESVELAAFTDKAGATGGERFGRVTTEPVAPGWVDEEAARPVEVGTLWIGAGNGSRQVSSRW